MQPVSQSAPTSRGMWWTGAVVSTLPVLMLLFSASMKFMQPADFMKEAEKLGYPDKIWLTIGITELVCTFLYVIPQTSVLGAILLTGYLGGATATHVRISDAFFGPILVGVFIWGGLWLRDARIRALVPWRR